MKKNFMCIALATMIPNLLFSAEQPYRMITPVIIPTPRSVLGNKGIDAKIMKSLSEDQQKILYGIQHPACIKALYGFSNQTISEKDKKPLADLPNEITNGLKMRVKRVTGSCFVHPEGYRSCGCDRSLSDLHASKVVIPTTIGSFIGGGAFLFKMLCCSPISMCGWATCALPIAAVPPIVALGCVETGICTYHRCCAIDEIIKFDTDSSSESEEQED